MKTNKTKLKEIAEELHKIANKDWNKCKEYNFGCASCHVWRVASEVEAIADFYGVLDKMK